MSSTPHLDKIIAAISNPKCAKDVPLLQEALQIYNKWIADLNSLTTKGKQRVGEMVKLLNEYKDTFEIDIIMH